MFCGNYSKKFVYCLLTFYLWSYWDPTVGTWSFPGVEHPRRAVDHPPPSSAEVQENIKLHLASPSGPSCLVLGWTSLLRPLRNGVLLWSKIVKSKSLDKGAKLYPTTNFSSNRSSNLCCVAKEQRNWTTSVTECNSLISVSVHKKSQHHCTSHCCAPNALSCRLWFKHR